MGSLRPAKLSLSDCLKHPPQKKLWIERIGKNGGKLCRIQERAVFEGEAWLKTLELVCSWEENKIQFNL
jgi:hypothetical protein